MSSIIKVNTIQDAGGNQILTSDGSGVITGNLSARPAFEAYGSANQTGISTSTWTKIAYNTERFDTNSMYDNSTNYRFTPTVAGKYFVYLQIAVLSETSFNLYVANASIYKNGSAYIYNPNNANSSYPENERTISINAVIDMNGTTDYVEGYARGVVSSGTVRIVHSSNISNFGAYKLPGV